MWIIITIVNYNTLARIGFGNPNQNPNLNSRVLSGAKVWYVGTLLKLQLICLNNQRPKLQCRKKKDNFHSVSGLFLEIRTSSAINNRKVPEHVNGQCQRLSLSVKNCPKTSKTLYFCLWNMNFNRCILFFLNRIFLISIIFL